MKIRRMTKEQAADQILYYASRIQELGDAHSGCPPQIIDNHIMMAVSVLNGEKEGLDFARHYGLEIDQPLPPTPQEEYGAQRFVIYRKRNPEEPYDDDRGGNGNHSGRRQTQSRDLRRKRRAPRKKRQVRLRLVGSNEKG